MMHFIPVIVKFYGYAFHLHLDIFRFLRAAPVAFHNATYPYALFMQPYKRFGQRIARKRKRHKMHARLRLRQPLPENALDIILRRKIDVDIHIADFYIIPAAEKRQYREILPVAEHPVLKHLLEFAVEYRREFGRHDSNGVIIISFYRIIGQVKRTRPYYAVVDYREFIVHKAAPPIAHNRDSATSDLFDGAGVKIVAVGNQPHADAARVRGHQRLRNSGGRHTIKCTVYAYFRVRDQLYQRSIGRRCRGRGRARRREIHAPHPPGV